MNKKNLTWFFSLFVIVAFCRAANGGQNSSEYSRALYEQAVEQYGLAMGERQGTDPARRLILRQIADVVCLLGYDVQACLDASRESKRPLGPYFGPLEPGKSLRDASFPATVQFLKELHKNSKHWGQDPSIASEALADIIRIQADSARKSLDARLRPEFEKILSNASSIDDFLKAFDLASRMLDQDSMVKTGLILSSMVASEKSHSMDDGTMKSLAGVLRATRDTMKILGRTQDESFSRLVEQCKRFDTKRLAAPDLDFPLAQSALQFKADLAAAKGQLYSLAQRAGLRSRASVLFTYLASYVGVVLQQPGAARPLSQILETLTVTDPWMAGRARGLLGLDAMQEGDFWSAASLLNESADVLKAFDGSLRIRGIAVANSAQAWFYLGQYQRAAKQFAVAAELFDGFALLRAKALAGIVHSQLFAGKPDHVEELLDEARRLVGQAKTDAQVALVANLELERALYLLTIGKKDRAVEVFEQVAKKGASQSKWSRKISSIAYTNLAEIMNDSSEFSKALSLSQRALKLLDPASQADATWQALCEKARALHGLGRIMEAAKAFEQSMNLVERLRSRVGAQGSKRSFAAAKKRLYANAIRALTSAPMARRAFFLTERARGRAFLDMLGQRQIKLGNQVLNNKVRTARAHMISTLPPVDYEFQDSAEALFGKQYTRSRSVHSKTTTLKPDPRKGWLSLVSVNPASVSDVQQVLKPKEGLVSFFHDGKSLEVFLITADGFFTTSVDVTGEVLTRRTEDLLRKLRRPDPGESKVRKKAKRLWDLTLGSISGQLDKLHSLVIVPWGPLHYIPFQTLYDGKRYAVDRWEIAVSPSASALVMIRSNETELNKIAGQRVFALGNPTTDFAPLPAAGREARLVGRLFSDAVVRTEKRATKESVLTEAIGSSIIHLASHGVFLSRRPMDSYLALAGAHEHTERLSALDILGMDLSRAKLVVLSACSSGKVRVADGEEMEGFSRAFLHAGTPALVASLWSISDSASVQFVEKFYGAIHKGLTPRAALSRAQRALKSRPEFSHPFYWAPFELVGS